MKDRILDMHAHLACLSEGYSGNLTQQGAYESGIQELILRRSQNIATFFSCGTPEEWEFTTRLLAKYEDNTEPVEDVYKNDGQILWKVEKRDIYLSFGIHPWYSDRYQPDDYRSVLKSCDAVGEIGMDSVWCDVPLNIQRRVLERQLQTAADLQKPVILHTKGQENEIAEMLRGFPEKICVHWYSGDIPVFEKYLEMDCYFTLGPDLRKLCNSENGAVHTEGKCPADGEKASADLYRYMLEQIPMQRLFLETDGISAVAWAGGQEQISLDELSAVLRGNLELLAQRKGVTGAEMNRCMWRNLENFLRNG